MTSATDPVSRLISKPDARELESGSVLRALGRGRSAALLRDTSGSGWSGGGLLAIDPVEVVEVGHSPGAPFLGKTHPPFDVLADAVAANPTLLWVGHLSYTPTSSTLFGEQDLTRNRASRGGPIPTLRFCGYAAWARILDDMVVFEGDDAAVNRLRLDIGEAATATRRHPRRPPQPPAAIAARSFDSAGYEAAVAQALEHIAAGDFYQVNIAQRFDLPPVSGAEAFELLGETCRSPYGAYLDCGDYEICSASPELFLRVSDAVATTRPIKGTRPRGGDATGDTQLAADLVASEKERAENLMIVDLERNDLGRVAESGSVVVPELWRVESFQTVHHLTSTVRARLADGVDLAELLRATFPGGSITGAPKLAAMKFIDEVEPVSRGIYTGAIGLVLPRDQMRIGGAGAHACPDLEMNIAIRTIVTDADATYLWVGAGIVADSVPRDEYRETIDKAAGIAPAIGLDLEQL